LIRKSESVKFGIEETISFDSQRKLPAKLQRKSEKVVECPSDAQVKEIVALLRKSFGVGFLGFDLIRNEKDGKLLLVDINYFPTYSNFPNFN
jgi:predicted ATP-grasp superfamily ATP-dependent carboligase